MRNVYSQEINAYMTSIDPHRIPFTTTLLFKSIWNDCLFEVISWDYEENQPPEVRYHPNRNENVRTSLLAAHDKLMDFQTQRSPPPSSSSSSAESNSGVQEGIVDRRLRDMIHQEIDSGNSKEGHKEKDDHLSQTFTVQISKQEEYMVKMTS